MFAPLSPGQRLKSVKKGPGFGGRVLREGLSVREREDGVAGGPGSVPPGAKETQGPGSKDTLVNQRFSC